jgi:hypothetical protein
MTTSRSHNAKFGPNFTSLQFLGFRAAILDYPLETTQLRLANTPKHSNGGNDQVYPELKAG